MLKLTKRLSALCPNAASRSALCAFRMSNANEKQHSFSPHWPWPWAHSLLSPRPFISKLGIENCPWRQPHRIGLRTQRNSRWNRTRQSRRHLKHLRDSYVRYLSSAYPGLPSLARCPLLFGSPWIWFSVYLQTRQLCVWAADAIFSVSSSSHSVDEDGP